MLAAVPYLHYMTTVVPGRAGSAAGLGPSARDVLTTDFLLLLPLLAISSLVGCFLSRRYGLAGLGSWSRLRRALPWVVPAGLAIGAASYLLVGRRFALQVPAYYPQSLGWALVLALKSALLEETVARFGMMTILTGLTRRPWLGNLLQALFFSSLNLKAFAFYGIPAGPLVWLSLLATVGVNLALGATYARWGLVAAATMHLLIDLRFIVHALLG
jgi:hypothetical protein